LERKIAVETNEYLTGSAELAAQLGCTKINQNNVAEYHLPPEHGDSWLMEAHPAAGLFVTNAYVTLLKPVVREYDIRQNGRWLCSVTNGVITILEPGKKARRLQPGIHLVQTGRQPFKMVFGTDAPIWFTSIWLFDEWIHAHLQDKPVEPSYNFADYGGWQIAQYNTPDILLLFEQLKFALRIASVPLMYYENKIGELLALIIRNVRYEWFWKRQLQEERRSYVTYQNKKYMFLVKEELDKDILNPPSIKQLTAVAGMGATKLRQCFKKIFGVTMDEYVRQEKMKEAMRLLSNDDLNIKNIAAAVGYKNSSQLIANFKKVHGFTPNEFRKLFGL
jgi:AraC-like DNA-binding protein